MSDANIIAQNDKMALFELTDEEIDQVVGGASLINISGNNVDVGAQVQVLTNKSGQGQFVGQH